jgi:hypothetical protein
MVLNSLTAVIDALLAFADKHAGHPLDPATFLTEDQIQELAALDALFYAFCLLLGLSLTGLKDSGPGPCRNSRLPFIIGKCHLPVEDGPDGTKREMVATGMVIFPTFEWQHAMKSLRAAADVIEAMGQLQVTAPPSKARGAGLGNVFHQHGDSRDPGRKSAKPRKGRPAGSKTRAHDLKLYSNWKAARRETGVTKAEFLRERGLPESDFAAIERGRKQANTENLAGKK